MYKSNIPDAQQPQTQGLDIPERIGCGIAEELFEQDQEKTIIPTA